MNERKITERIKKSALQAENYFDYEKLARSQAGLVPCSYEEELEELLVTYDMTGLKAVTEIKAEATEVQYQFLINLGGLYPLSQNYQFSLYAENVFYDENTLPCVKARDIYPAGRLAGTDFLAAYKAYIGGVLGKTHTVRQLLDSGLEPLKKEAFFREYFKADSAAALQELLRAGKAAYLEQRKTRTKVVTKSVNYFKTTAAFVFSALFLAAAVVLAYGVLVVVPEQKQIIAANESFIARDYVSCIDSLKPIAPEKMSMPTKYILASAYARSESLKKSEIEGIVSKLSPAANEKELDYWIYLGRLEAKKAQNLAQALSDDKLLMYAYMKELSQLEANMQIAGEDKAARIEELSSAITGLGEKYEVAEAGTGEEADNE